MDELAKILRANFSPHRVGRGRVFSPVELIIYGIIPLAGGAALSWRLGRPSEEYLALLIAVYGVLAAVLVGLLPIVYSIASGTYTAHAKGEYPAIDHERRRLEVLQDLYSTISYGTILLVAALASLIAMLFLPDPATSDNTESTLAVLECFVYFVGCSTILSILNVAMGVFTSMEDQVCKAKERLEKQAKVPEVGDEHETSP